MNSISFKKKMMFIISLSQKNKVDSKIDLNKVTYIYNVQSNAVAEIGCFRQFKNIGK